ncbi:hypothetical protein MNBD_ALPHA06-1851 [hydrothermal vent metagenome]|uniref:Uncharacterized protein n=1 Tax=hydrothermal vent metagenome TaxID=652676 RepID=A0A3B0RH57_9ZZZZ
MSHTKQIVRFAMTGILGLALITTPAFADVSVQKNDAGWQVVADAEPMTNVLSVLSKQANIKLSGTQKLITDPDVSGTFEGSLKDVLSRILRGVDYATETGADAQITRLIVLSGEIGQNPSERVIRTARRIPAKPVAVDPVQARKDGARVTSLLQTNARVAAGLATQNDQNAKAQSDTAGSGSGITRNEDGTFDIDPETQARMAEATRRAQADLQALVNSLRQNEDQN